MSPNTYKAVQVVDQTGKMEVVEKPIPEPKDGEVLVKVSACGVCHSDCFWVYGAMGIQHPAVPGHEVVGKVVKVGATVSMFKEGQRVGVGWFGGACHDCNSCRRGQFISCTKGYTTGIRFEGGYGGYVCAPSEAVAAVPEGLTDEEAAPLLCAGVTVFNSLRNAHILAGGIVAVQGLGGLGHLGIQFANKMGYRTVAISASDRKKDLALKLGAHHYIDSSTQDIAQELQKLGGADAILATAPTTVDHPKLIDGLGIKGKLILLGAGMEPFSVGVLPLLMGSRSIVGWPSGVATDSEDCLKFAALFGVRSVNEIYPVEKAQEAYERMMSGKANIRVVLTHSH